MTDRNESTRVRRAIASAAAVLALCFWLATQVYFVSVTRGGDRNGYLLGGKMLAEGRTRGIVPPDPYVYLGPHWVMVKPGRFELKYPLGLPSIYAIIYKLAGSGDWWAAAHQISPLAAAVGVFGTFLLLRPLIGSFRALLGLILIATCPIMFFFANLPNSHAAALGVAVWGMYFLLDWRSNGGIWRAIAAGCLLGLNFTIRYTEGLLILPLLLTAIFAIRKNRGLWSQSVAMFVTWLVPVSVQVVFNLIVLHHPSGYSLTNESTAFSMSRLFHNWPTMLGQLYANGIGFLLALSLLGLIAMFIRQREMAMILAAWIIPPLVVYTSYYWSPADEPGLSYARFVLTILPGLALLALWYPPKPSRWINLILTLMVCFVAAANIPTAILRAAALKSDNLDSKALLDQVRAGVPAGSAIFTEQQNIPMLEVAGDWRLYLSDLFTHSRVQTYAAIDSGAPQILQPERAARLYSLLGGLSDAQLAGEQNRLLTTLLAGGVRVFVALPGVSMNRFTAAFLDPVHWRAIPITQWREDNGRGNDPSHPAVTMQIVEIVAAS